MVPEIWCHVWWVWAKDLAHWEGEAIRPAEDWGKVSWDQKAIGWDQDQLSWWTEYQESLWVENQELRRRQTLNLDSEEQRNPENHWRKQVKLRQTQVKVNPKPQTIPRTRHRTGYHFQTWRKSKIKRIKDQEHQQSISGWALTVEKEISQLQAVQGEHSQQYLEGRKISEKNHPILCEEFVNSNRRKDHQISGWVD